MDQRAPHTYRAAHRLLPLFFAWALSSCGGGGGGGGGENVNTPSTPLTPPPAPSDNWESMPTIGESYILLSHNETSDSDEIYLYNPSNNTHRLLSGNMVTGAKVSNIELSPDGRKIAYVADKETDNKYEIFITSINAEIESKPIEIPSSHLAGAVRWTKDSSALIYSSSLASSSIYTTDKSETGVVDIVSKKRNVLLGRPSGSGVSRIWNTEKGLLAIGTYPAYSGNQLNGLLVIDYSTNTEHFRSAEGPVENLNWSADGRYLSFSQQQADDVTRRQLKILDTEDFSVKIIFEGDFKGADWSDRADFFQYWTYDSTISGYRGYLYQPQINQTTLFHTQPTSSSLSVSSQYWNQALSTLFYTTRYPASEDNLYAYNIENKGLSNLSELIEIDQSVWSMAVGENGNIVAANSKSGSDSRIFLIQGNGSGGRLLNKISALEKRISQLTFTKSEDNILVRMPSGESPHLVQYTIDSDSLIPIKATPINDRPINCIVFDYDKNRSCNRPIDLR